MTPKEMVAKSAQGRITKGWYDSLTDMNRKYVDDVISEMKKTGVFAPYVVADFLSDELSLSVSRDVIARKIKDLLRNA